MQASRSWGVLGAAAPTFLLMYDFRTNVFDENTGGAHKGFHKDVNVIIIDRLNEDCNISWKRLHLTDILLSRLRNRMFS